MTPTLVAAADIILPAATYPERDGLRFGDGPQRGETINKVVQIGECKSDMQINLEMGKRWNPEAYPWDNVQDMFSSMLKGAGMDMTFPGTPGGGPGLSAHGIPALRERDVAAGWRNWPQHTHRAGGTLLDRLRADWA